MTTSSPLCQLNGGCMGCCGHSFVSKDKIQEAVSENTKEFKSLNPSTEEKFIVFRDRRQKMDLRDGVCRNLVNEKGNFFCPLHPVRHQGKDLRVGHCDINYLCRTAKTFEGWDEIKKRKFLRFIESRKMDNITYSMKMDDNSLLKEFLSS